MGKALERILGLSTIAGWAENVGQETIKWEIPVEREESMVTESEIAAKMDEELLSMWADQNSYVSEVVGWVTAEIGRRQLDTDGIHIIATEEVNTQAELGEARTLLRLLTLAQGAFGLLLLFVSPLEGSLIMAVAGLLLIAFAVGVWRENKWAILLGFIFYCIAAVWNAGVTTLEAIAVFRYGAGDEGVRVLLLHAFIVLASCCFAGAFNTLRKRQSMSASKPDTT